MEMKDTPPEWILFCWRDHVDLFKKILSEGGIEKATPLVKSVYHKQKRYLKGLGLESAGRVGYGK